MLHNRRQLHSSIFENHTQSISNSPNIINRDLHQLHGNVVQLAAATFVCVSWIVHNRHETFKFRLFLSENSYTVPMSTHLIRKKIVIWSEVPPSRHTSSLLRFYFIPILLFSFVSYLCGTAVTRYRYYPGTSVCNWCVYFVFSSYCIDMSSNYTLIMSYQYSVADTSSCTERSTRFGNMGCFEKSKNIYYMSSSFRLYMS